MLSSYPGASGPRRGIDPRSASFPIAAEPTFLLSTSPTAHPSSAAGLIRSRNSSALFVSIVPVPVTTGPDSISRLRLQGFARSCSCAPVRARSAGVDDATNCTPVGGRHFVSPGAGPAPNHLESQCRRSRRNAPGMVHSVPGLLREGRGSCRRCLSKSLRLRAHQPHPLATGAIAGPERPSSHPYPTSSGWAHRPAVGRIRPRVLELAQRTRVASHVPSFPRNRKPLRPGAAPDLRRLLSRHWSTTGERN